MPGDVRARQRTGAGCGLLLVLVLAAVLPGSLPGGRPGGGCRALTGGHWSADAALTGAFARYGDDSSRTDDWTGGDGTHSVRLPDGRVLWLFSDTYLGQVHAPPGPSGESAAWRDASAPLVRNSAVVMDADGRLVRTLAAPLFPDPGPGQWRWPVAARVEPRSPGSAESVVRVLLWVRTAGAPPWIYGVPSATEVATLSLPGLRLESVVPVLDQRLVPDPARRVLFGTALVAAGEWTYVFGGDDRRAVGRPVSYAYAARVERGRLADPGAWRYWDGSAWVAGARLLRPVLGDGLARGVGSAFSVVRDGGTYLLFTMAGGARGLTTVTSYWACSPTGPWHGPGGDFAVPLPGGAVAAYNPQVHPALGGGGRLVLSYDVNRLDAANVPAAVSGEVSLYRPRFVTVRPGPPG